MTRKWGGQRETHAGRERSFFPPSPSDTQSQPDLLHTSSETMLSACQAYAHICTHPHKHTQTHAIQLKTAENNSAYSIHTNRQTHRNLFFNRRTGMQVLDLQISRCKHKDKQEKRDKRSFLNCLSHLCSLSHKHLQQSVFICHRGQKAKSQRGHRGEEVLLHSRCSSSDSASHLHLRFFCTQR